MKRGWVGAAIFLIFSLVACGEEQEVAVENTAVPTSPQPQPLNQLRRKRPCLQLRLLGNKRPCRCQRLHRCQQLPLFLKTRSSDQQACRPLRLKLVLSTDLYNRRLNLF